MHVHAYTVHRGSQWHWHEDRANSQSWVCLTGHPKNVVGLNLNFLNSCSPLTWPWIEGNDRETLREVTVLTMPLIQGRSSCCRHLLHRCLIFLWWKMVEGRIKIPLKKKKTIPIKSFKDCEIPFKVNRWGVKLIDIPHTFAKHKFTTSALIQPQSRRGKRRLMNWVPHAMTLSTVGACWDLSCRHRHKWDQTSSHQWQDM